MAQVHKFLKTHMVAKTAGGLYVSGAPGTGKTAVLTHIIDDLKVCRLLKYVQVNWSGWRLTLYSFLFPFLMGVTS